MIQNICSVPICQRPAESREWCHAHYKRWLRTGDVRPNDPIIERLHPKYGKDRKCDFPDCGREHNGNGLCQAHGWQLKMGYDLTSITLRMPKGSGWLDKDGYRRFGSLLEHRIVMEDYIGRPLLRHENVHHKNGQKTQNNIENLELWSTAQPSGQRVVDKLEWMLDFIDQYLETDEMTEAIRRHAERNP